MKNFFLAKYNSAGTVQWVQQATVGGLGYDGVYGTGLAVDGAGNSYAVGFGYGATITFGTTNLTIPNDYGESTFLVKYDNTGTIKWAQLMGGSDETYATKVAVDAAGNVYVRGTFFSTLTIGTQQSGGQPPGSTENMFVAKFDNSGALTWVQQPTGGNVDEGGVAVDPAGNVYVSGSFDHQSELRRGISLTNMASRTTFR